MQSLKSYGVRHKVFIFYHHDDQHQVNQFINIFDNTRDTFIVRVLGLSNDIINSTDTSYVMRRIRELYIKDSTVTVVLLGNCTWARRYVDWEIQASLYSSTTSQPNGLLGIKLPNSKNVNYPDRLNRNLLSDTNTQNDCYARVIDYPTNIISLVSYIQDAFNARTSRKHLIVNPRNRFNHNRTCS
jgi:hypothetical protein